MRRLQDLLSADCPQSLSASRLLPNRTHSGSRPNAGTTGISKVSAGATLSSGNDVLTALITAQNKMDEDEVSPENRILYITPTLYNLAINVDTTKSKAVLDGFAKIVKSASEQILHCDRS